MPGPFAQVAVVGGGWSGIAAAVELALGGCSPALFEAAPALGGRARAVRLSLAGTEITVDNGQHLLLGAYRECLRLIATVNGAQPPAMQRARLRLESVDGLSLVPWRLPAPLHLAGALLAARGLGLRERAALVALLAGLRRRQWRVPAGETVAALLARTGQPASLRARLWNPLVVAALNTGAEHACAQTFANVLRDSLGASAAACDFVLADPDLTQLLPAPAERWLHANGATLHLRTTVRAVRPDAGGWRLDTTRGEFAAGALVLALPPYAAARLIEGEASRATAAQRRTIDALQGFRYDSIATVYLAWPARAPLSLPRWVMLDETAGDECWGQWLFDRGERNGLRVAAVVVSARGRLDAIDPARLARGIARQVRTQLDTPEPADARTVVDKRATFRCTPERPRLRPDSLGAPGFALAGDFAYPEYPATLEAAVRSGVEAARVVLRHLRPARPSVAPGGA
ncbi:MAG TPA: hydroxysqualene dehydroxylase HpnE [Burkholderiaceae bacterium]